MARTTPMRLVELMVLKQDIDPVIEFLGKRRNFQFQSKPAPAAEEAESGAEAEPREEGRNDEEELLARLRQAGVFLGISLPEGAAASALIESAARPGEAEASQARQLLASVESLRERSDAAAAELSRVRDANEEAHSFSNLKVPFEELDHLSFLSLRVGKIDPSQLSELKAAVGERAVIVPLADEGADDRSKILAASSKRARFSLDTELRKFGFVGLEIPRDFKGVPDDVLASLRAQLEECERNVAFIDEERRNTARTHEEQFRRLVASFTIGSQITEKRNSLESTSLVYRLTGWIPEADCHAMMKDLDSLTGGRIAIRVYKPGEVLSVVAGEEKVPVRLSHGKLVGAFERLIFSYGSPVYGSIDPTPLVAVFFTVLFGIMFGDAGQGLVFLILGLLMAFKVVRVGGWGKFAPIFMSIGVSSMIMGVLTGEFFGNEEILKPVARAITGAFGEPRDQILHLMPNEGKQSIVNMFMFFGFTVAVGFFINSIGLVVNIANQFALNRPGRAIFGKNGISGSLFFWYVVVLAVRIAAFHHSVAVYDIVVVALTLLCTAFSEPLSRLVSGERPVLENGVGGAIIEGVVEILETVISYLSSSISFIRVGAFALAHAVLGLIISTLTEMAGPGGIGVMVVGNGIVVVLEGMIVAIQVIRLQYYEFFSKFFNETGREFKPFAFEFK